MSENLRTYTKALFGLDATVARVTGDRWTSPSPCTAWTAADVIAHNVGMNRMITGFTTGVGAAGPDHVVADDPAESWRDAFAGLLEALDRPGSLQTVAATPWGEMPVDKFLGFAWVDPLIHTWDLAIATGQAPVLDAALVARGTTQLERAGDSLVGPGRFEPAVTAAPDADPISTFVALSGRDPSASAG